MESLLFPLLLIALMYALLIRPQQQRARAQRELHQSLGVGDRVVTVGGLAGRIVELDGEWAGIEASPGVVLRFRRLAIGGRLPDDEAGEGA